MELGLAVSSRMDADFKTYARRAEAAGIGSVWVTSGIGERGRSAGIGITNHDPFLRLQTCAKVTEEIRLGVGVLGVYERTAASAAQSIASLDARTGGRATLGVGASHPEIATRVHGADDKQPVETLQRFSETVQGMTSAEGARHRTRPRHVDADIVFDLPRDRIPVYVAALGPKNISRIGMYADGWLPNLFPRTGLADAVETIRRAAREHGRPADAVTVAPWVLTIVREDSAAARDLLAKQIASYVSERSYYANLVSRFGYDEEVRRIRRTADDNGSVEAASEHVTDEMTAVLGVAGTPDEAREQILAYREAGADHPILYPRGNAAADVDRLLETVTGWE